MLNSKFGLYLAHWEEGNTYLVTHVLDAGFRERQHSCQASLVAQRVHNLPAMQETWVPSLGQGDPLEKGGATH